MAKQPTIYEAWMCTSRLVVPKNRVPEALLKFSPRSSCKVMRVSLVDCEKLSSSRMIAGPMQAATGRVIMRVTVLVKNNAIFGHLCPRRH